MPALRRALLLPSLWENINLQCEDVKGLPGDPGLYHPHHRSARYQGLTLDAPFIQPRHDDACAYARTQADTSAEEVRCAVQGIVRIRRLYVLCLFRHLLVHLTTRIHTAEVIHISMAEIIGLQYQILQLDGEAGDAGASLMAVIIILLLPAMTPQPPKRVLALRSHERKIVLTEDQEQNPPRLPLPSTLPSPTVGLASRTRMRRCGVLPTVVEEGSGEGAVCAGW
ncbi:hypothetical protein B0H14DRAFT_3713939 [Mycena olivaceomarginata]|nr:hypothetical protein B0H14DRAFT_3713939 [Mycena olivaceomarginata]